MCKYDDDDDDDDEEDGESITAEAVFRKILGGTMLDQSLMKMEQVDVYEATLRHLQPADNI